MVWCSTTSTPAATATVDMAINMAAIATPITSMANRVSSFYMQAPKLAAVPRYVAIIINLNRRWLNALGLLRTLGLASGAERVRQHIGTSFERSVRYVALFSFHAKNGKRQANEVSGLLGLFLLQLQRQAGDMNAIDVNLKIISDCSCFGAANAAATPSKF